MMRTTLRCAAVACGLLLLAALNGHALNAEPESVQPVSVQAQSQAQASSRIADDTAFDSRARAINQQIRCPVCQGSSIQESPSPEATSMKAIVRERLAAGDTDDQIKAYFVSRYGEWILLKPPAHGINLLVYILPILLLLGGGLFVYRTARKWTAPV